MTEPTVLHTLAMLVLGAGAGMVAMRLPLPGLLTATLSAAGTGMRTMTRGAVSDHWKERALRICTSRLLRGMAGLLACIAALVGGAAVVALAFGALLPGAWAMLLTLWGTLAVAAGSLLHVVLTRSWRHV